MRTMEMRRRVRTITAGWLVLVLIFLTGCTAKTPGSSEGKNAQEAKEAESMKTEGEGPKKDLPLISEKEARKVAWQAISKTNWILEDQYKGYYKGLESGKDLKVGDLYTSESELEYHFFHLREKIPGKYAKFVYYDTDEEGEEWLSLCLYVNLRTKEVFADEGYAGVYKLPGDEMVIYQPYAFDGYNDEGFLLQVLEKKKIIPNKEDYITSVSLFWMRHGEEEAPEAQGSEDGTTEGTAESDLGETSQSDGDFYEDIFPEEGKIRLEVMKESDPDTILGTYVIDTQNHTVTDEKNGKVIYKDWVPKYKPIKVTKKTAPEEALKILDKLEALDLPMDEYTAKVTGKIEEEELENWPEVYGYEVVITPKSSKESPLVMENYIVRPDGTVLWGVDPGEEDSYSCIYGCWQDHE